MAWALSQSQPERGVMRLLLLTLLLLAGYVGHCQAQTECDTFGFEGEGSYWDLVGVCPNCASQPDCTFCLSTLTCMSIGSSIPCPDSVENSASCPGEVKVYF